MNKYFKNKNILITGFEGFLGSNLTKTLLDYNANIYGLDILTNRDNTILINNYGNINIIKGDVADFDTVFEIIKKNKIGIIFHLAAESLVGKAFTNPRNTFSTNICGTWNILEASRISKTVKSIVVASSDKAYGSHNKLPYKEKAPLSGSHPYDVSKSCADLLTYTYFKTYGLPVCVTRCGNIFGPGDFNFSRIIPDSIKSMVLNKTLIIRSDGKYTRDYIYVDDIVSGYLVLAAKMDALKLYGEAFNFSNENPISVLDLVKLILKINGKGKLNYEIKNLAEKEIKHQYLSAGKAKKVLAWKPEHSLEEGLEKTITWYQNYFLKESL
jgi:CDP-glucose 4,6-dehydratase